MHGLHSFSHGPATMKQQRKKEPLVMMVTLPHVFQWEKDTGSLNRIIKQLWNFSEKPVSADYMTGCTHGGILLFMSGKHSSAQWKEAKKMFQKACDAGEDPSCYNLGTLSYKEGRQKRAIKYYKQGVQNG